MLGRMKEKRPTKLDIKKLKADLQKIRDKSPAALKKDMTAIADSLENLLDSSSRGGRERAKKLSKKRRSEIARNAANARWARRG